jgi:two-component sensor histidine kinase
MNLDAAGCYKAPKNPSGPDGEASIVKQCLRYAEDLSRIYEEEKQKRKALEKANEELNREIVARTRAESDLREAQLTLEKRVSERTEALASVNRTLQVEVDRRRRIEEQVRASLEEKEILLSEVHHRVKNNLQIISSLLGLQCSVIHDQKVVNTLRDSQARIRSMALIHEQLYRSGNLAAIDFSDYVQGLVSELLRANTDVAARVVINVSVDQLLLPVGMALSCGLIINELVTNSLKHAFSSEAHGDISIDFHGGESDWFTLIVSDNGRGLPRDFDYRRTTSLGLQLVVNLAEVQLRGTVEVLPGNGTTFKIRFRPRSKP